MHPFRQQQVSAVDASALLLLLMVSALMIRVGLCGEQRHVQCRRGGHTSAPVVLYPVVAAYTKG
jgi:hypothetical protein